MKKEQTGNQRVVCKQLKAIKRPRIDGNFENPSPHDFHKDPFLNLGAF